MPSPAPWVNKMDTPICDFVHRYAEHRSLRLHMPGHKGQGPLGCEHLDITEIPGSDSLYEADGIIARSEANAASLFGCPTFYSTEGSSQCIRAMLYLAVLHAKAQGKRPKIAAARNVHKAFLSAAALLQTEVTWLFGNEKESYLSCSVTAANLATLDDDVTALYITSPDYLGNMADIRALAAVCRQKGILLLVDNAHGAYLRFLPESLHPMDLGADICCDSAHKTLPVLTGGAYLHIQDAKFAARAKDALALFGSTSPSYLILQSLDAANAYLSDGYREKLAVFLKEMAGCKSRLGAIGNEPMKLTIDAKARGYTGTELARLLRDKNIECEFADPDYLVLMPTPETGLDGLRHIEDILHNIPQKTPIVARPPVLPHSERVCSIRQALLSPGEIIPVEECLDRVLASPSVGCPPAVPILVCGEKIDENAIACFHYYGIDRCSVL